MFYIHCIGIRIRPFLTLFIPSLSLSLSLTLTLTSFLFYAHSFAPKDTLDHHKLFVILPLRCPEFVPNLLNNDKKHSFFHFIYMSSNTRQQPTFYVSFTFFFLILIERVADSNLFWSILEEEAIRHEKNFTPQENPDTTQYISHSRKSN